METLKDVAKDIEEKIKKRAEKNKGLHYRMLWVKVSFATARDGHIRDIGARAFGVFFVIRTFMDKEGFAYPSLKTISYLSGCSLVTAKKEIDKLVDEGWIKKSRRKRTVGGKFDSNLYEILQRDLIRGTNESSFLKEPVLKSSNDN
jgi:hypothetical protein